MAFLSSLRRHRAALHLRLGEQALPTTVALTPPRKTASRGRGRPGGNRGSTGGVSEFYTGGTLPHEELDPKLSVQVAAAAAAMMKEWWLFVPIFRSSLIYLFKPEFIFLFTPFTTSKKFSLEAKQELERAPPPPPPTHPPTSCALIAARGRETLGEYRPRDTALR